MQILKFILKLLGGLAALLVVVGVVAFNWDGISFQYDKLFWEPNALSLDGVSLSDTRSDVIFQKGQPDERLNSMLLYRREYNDSYSLQVNFDNSGSVDTIFFADRSLGLPFRNVDQMKEILGEEDILSTSNDFVTRRYTYLEWGVTYEFAQNRLIGLMIGDVQWREATTVGEYIVQGEVICPGNECPWDEDGKLKSEYEDKDYRVFLSRN